MGGTEALVVVGEDVGGGVGVGVVGTAMMASASFIIPSMFFFQRRRGTGGITSRNELMLMKETLSMK